LEHPAARGLIHATGSAPRLQRQPTLALSRSRARASAPILSDADRHGFSHLRQLGRRVFLGRLGVESLAAFGLCFPFAILTQCLLLGFSNGITTAVATARGATESAVQFKKANVMEALEDRLETAQFDYLDPFRKSVV
jgi:hypothetical protein